MLVLCMFKPFSDANRGVELKAMHIMLKQEAETRIRQRPDAQPRPQVTAPIHAKAFLFSFLCRWWCGRTGGRQCHWMPPPQPQALVPWSPRRQQIRGAARHDVQISRSQGERGEVALAVAARIIMALPEPALALAGTATGMHLHGLFLSSVPGLI